MSVPPNISGLCPKHINTWYMWSKRSSKHFHAYGMMTERLCVLFSLLRSSLLHNPTWLYADVERRLFIITHYGVTKIRLVFPFGSCTSQGFFLILSQLTELTFTIFTLKVHLWHKRLVEWEQCVKQINKNASCPQTLKAKRQLTLAVSFMNALLYGKKALHGKKKWFPISLSRRKDSVNCCKQLILGMSCLVANTL